MTDIPSVIENPGAPPAPAAPAAKTWFEGADEATRGYLQNRGWDKLDPGAAALEAAKAHQEAQKMLGVPADKLVRLADPTDEVAYKAMWSKLGYPGDKAKYDFSDIKRANGEPLSEDVLSSLRDEFDAAKVPLAQAKRIVAALAKQQDTAGQREYETKQQTLANEKDALAKLWGNSHEANLFVAKQAAAKSGISPEALAALEGQIGYKAVMEHFRSLGERMGEAKFVNNQLPNGDQMPFTTEGAASKKAELMSDPQFVKRYMDGGINSPEGQQLMRLNEAITGQRAIDVRRY